MKRTISIQAMLLLAAIAGCSDRPVASDSHFPPKQQEAVAIVPVDRPELPIEHLESDTDFLEVAPSEKVDTEEPASPEAQPSEVASPPFDDAEFEKIWGVPRNPEPSVSELLPLRKLPIDGGPVPRQIQQTLDHAYSPDALETLYKLLDHENATVRTSAMDSIAWIVRAHVDAAEPEDTVTDTKKLLERLRLATRDPSEPVCLYACDLLRLLKVTDEDTVRHLIAVLVRFEPQAKRSAAETLGDMGAAGRPAVSALIEASRGSNIVRNVAGPALAKIGGDEARKVIDELKPRLRESHEPGAAEALARFGEVEPLLQLQDHESEHVRSNVAHGLGFVRPTNEDVAKALCQLVIDEDYSVRGTALDALSECEPKLASVLPTLIDRLDDPVDYVARKAAETFTLYQPDQQERIATLLKAVVTAEVTETYRYTSRLAEDEEVFDSLLAVMQDTSADLPLRVAAAECLRICDDDTLEPHEATFQAIYDDPNTAPEVRAFADTLLRKITFADQADIALQASLVKTSKVPLAIDRALRDMYWNHGETVDPAMLSAIVAAIKHDDPQIVMSGAHVAEELNLNDSAVQAALLDAFLRDWTIKQRVMLIEAIGSCGKGSTAVERTLIASTTDENYEIRDASAEALGAMQAQSKAAIDALLALIRSQRDAPFEAVLALPNCGEHAQTAIPELIAMLDDPLQPRWAIVEALANFGEPAAEAVPRMLRLATSESNTMRYRVATSLASFPSRANESVPILIRMLNDEDETVREHACDSLGRLRAAKAVPALTGLVENEQTDQSMTIDAVIALGEIGPDAKSAIPALTKLLKETSEYHIKEFIQDALLKIALDE